MKQTIVLKLEPSPEHHAVLLETMETFNRACQYVADVAYEKRLANKIALQPFVYGTIRKEFGLSADMAIRAIAKPVEAYKRDKRVHVQIDPRSAIVHNPRTISFKGLTHASITTIAGRILVPFRFGAYQAARIGYPKGEMDMVYRGSEFYLHVTIDLPTPPPIETDGALGVDLGITQVAVDSDGEAFTGEQVMECRRRVRQHRTNIQKRRTRSAYKRLQKQSRRQSRYVRDVNHCISKRLVQKAFDCRKALAIETLKGIRERVHGSRQMRWLLGSWSFYQLASFIRYKAEMLGVPLVEVDPAYTSQTCSRCGHCERANRPSQSKFLCKSCGLDMNADHNAALNIRARAEVMPPNVPAFTG